MPCFGHHEYEYNPNQDTIFTFVAYSIDIEGITSDSRHVRRGSLFVAIEGSRFDGHDFVNEAIDRGAVAVVTSATRSASGHSEVPIILVSNTRATLAQLASEFYGHPSQQIKVIGITGTNGKTTVSYLADKILTRAGFGVGLIGTINYRIAERLIPAGNTTPDSIALQSFLSEMVSKNLDYAIVEVSSHALDQYRVEDIDFDVGLFTNLTHDHLDYHLTLDRYFQAKAKLFEKLNPTSSAIINIDDVHGRKLIDIIRNSSTQIISYGMDEKADIRAENLKDDLSGMEFSVLTPVGSIDIETKLIGRHNLYNILGAVGIGLSQEVGLPSIRDALQQLDQVPGRLELVDYRQSFRVFVDYAHSEDALKWVLQTLRKLTTKRVGIVFGCGGDRDSAKRSRMGEVASRFADYIILTTDNPRSEDPSKIINDIIKGIDSTYKNYKIILDRFSAIAEILSMAEEGDTVLIAGKGHETYQIFSDHVEPFDDREVVRKILSERLLQIDTEKE